MSPVWLVLVGIASVQLGAGFAKSLFDDVAPTTIVWLRLVTSALVLVAVLRPRVRGRSREDWVVVLAFAIINGSAGARLAGVAIPFLDVQTAAAAVLPGAVAADGTQALRTTQEAQGYSPRNVQIYAGFATTWTIESKSASSCASSLVVPSLNISKRLKLGTNTINLPPMKAGVLRYSCSMGMYSATITIVDPPAGFSPTSGPAGSSSPRG